MDLLTTGPSYIWSQLSEITDPGRELSASVNFESMPLMTLPVQVIGKLLRGGRSGGNDPSCCDLLEDATMRSCYMYQKG